MVAHGSPSWAAGLVLGGWCLRHVTFDEAVECFFADFEVHRNKSYRDRYQLLGRTLGGRSLKIIFQLKPGNIVRIITGWDA